MKLRKKFWGSNVALTLGILSVLSGVSQISQGKTNSAVEAGIIIIFSVIAYKSIKKRRLELKKTTKVALGLEIASLIVIGMIMFAGLLRGFMYEDPFPFLVIPLFGIGAYKIAYDGSPSGSLISG